MTLTATLVMLAATVVVAGLVALMLRRQWQSVVAAPRQTDIRILAEHVADKISTHDADGTFRYISSVFAGLLGEYPGTLVGRKPRDFAHPGDASALEALWKRTISLSGATAIATWRCRRHDGEYVWLETTARMTVGEAAALGPIVCASRDVTERKQIEDALRDSEQRFRTTLEAVRLVAVGLDALGNVTFCNDALATLTGWQRAELLGENWFDKCVAPGDPARELFFERILRGETPPKYESELVCRDGTRRMIEWDTTILRGPMNEVAGTASLGADVTERRRYEAKILQARDDAEAASRAKSDFLSRMSHELRTPLNSVIGFANVMRKNKGGRLSEDDIAYLERIIANGQHLLVLVNNVLDIAKVEAGRLTVTSGLVSVGQLVQDVVAQLEGQPRSPDVELVAQVAPVMAPIQTDGVLLRQVIINLAGNALRFTHRGRVVVSATADGGGAPTSIVVADTGIGISKARQAAIFEPFEQADAETHRNYGGTGLGLSISKAICDALGFDILLDSEPGKGSTFTVRFSPAPSAEPVGGQMQGSFQ
jgi:two-component system, sensor histidine kinase and response regulator